MKKEKTKSKLPKIPKKLQEKANEASAKLETYLKKNKLDPTKDWSKDKKHGAKIKEMLTAINIVREKIKEVAPVEIHHKKSDDKKKKANKVEKESKPKADRPTKYDYPLVDGKEMSSSQKKKYRAEMRSKSGGKVKKDKVESKKPKTPTVEEKPSLKSSKGVIKGKKKKVKKTIKAED